MMILHSIYDVQANNISMDRVLYFPLVIDGHKEKLYDCPFFCYIPYFFPFVYRPTNELALRNGLIVGIEHVPRRNRSYLTQFSFQTMP